MDNNKLKKLIFKYMDSLKWNSRHYTNGHTVYFSGNNELNPEFIFTQTNSLSIDCKFYLKIKTLFSIDDNLKLLEELLSSWFRLRQKRDFNGVMLSFDFK